ncbi:MAG: cell division protein SepF [Schwartzia sp.]|nr:cell division protein SepF [Schwartzia sp. (in: firmicutes)]
MGLVEKLKELIDLGEDDEFEDEEFEEFEEKEESTEVQQKPAVSAVPFAAAAATQKAASVFPQKSVAMSQQTNTSVSSRPKLTVHTTKVPELAVEIHVPSNFDQVARIADDLLANRATVVNFERVDAPEQRRICDFINGVSYVLDCEARRISDIMVLYVPSGVDVSTARPKPVQN